MRPKVSTPQELHKAQERIRRLEAIIRAFRAPPNDPRLLADCPECGRPCAPTGGELDYECEGCGIEF